MSDLKQREQEFEAEAARINGGRKPKFGDLMRNPWASEDNPQRDGYFVRERRQGGRFNPGHYYELTDKCGNFWETQAKYAFFIDTQPEATAPAQDLSAAILEGAEGSDAPEENALFEADMRKHGYWDADLKRNGSGLYVHDHVHRMWTGWMARAALASSANALSAGDRVDAVEGDLLPPVSSKVLIHLARQDEWVEHTVTGYYAWQDLSGRYDVHRVFVRVVDAAGYDNARLLQDVRLQSQKGGSNG